MVTCTACGRPIERIPSWMQGIQTEFICTNCPNRQMKNIAFVTFEPEAPAKTLDADELDVAEVVVEEEAAEEEPEAEEA